MVIDFRLRPPLRGFLDTLMYCAGERRDGFKAINIEPDSYAVPCMPMTGGCIPSTPTARTWVCR